MEPFHQSRLWIRRSAGGERLVAAGGAALVIATLAFVLVPPDPSVRIPSRADTQGPGQAGAPSAAATVPVQQTVTGTGGATAQTGSRSAGGAQQAGAPGGGGGASASQAQTAGGTGNPSGGPQTRSASCATSPPGTDQGISASQIKVAITLVNIVGPAANNAFGIQSASQQETLFNDIIDSVNASGGIACRRVVPIYFQGNPADQTQLEQTCLQVAQTKVFAVLDPGSYSHTTPICFAQNNLPYFGGFILTDQEAEQGFPYLFDLGDEDALLRDTVFGFQQRGEFDPAKGFQKLGIYYHDCHPELIKEELAALARAGVQSSQIVPYDFGCPTAFANPSDVEQATLQFRSANVNEVTDVDAEGDFMEFTNVAQQQGYKPQYVLPDEELVGISNGAEAPNSTNADRAMVVTTSSNGQEDTPGLPVADGTKKCDAIMAAHGQPPVYQQEQLAGDACNMIWMFEAAVEHAPALSRTALAAGLQRARSVDFSYPQGPDDFSGNHVTTAGQYWRVAQYYANCTCWKVIDPVFHSGY